MEEALACVRGTLVLWSSGCLPPFLLARRPRTIPRRPCAQRVQECTPLLWPMSPEIDYKNNDDRPPWSLLYLARETYTYSSPTPKQANITSTSRPIRPAMTSKPSKPARCQHKPTTSCSLCRREHNELQQVGSWARDSNPKRTGSIDYASFLRDSKCPPKMQP